jgi:CubicO group peptidase (beta-lactamase class C family)
VLSKVIARVTGRSVASLMRQRIFKPLGLRHTAISTEPAMRGPVLHAYTAQRGPYEDSTYWSPSWTLGAGSVMSSTIGDVALSARALGTGALISPRASRERFAPTTVGMGGFTKHLYFGLGILVVNGWYLQNPQLNGYTGAMAYLPGRKLSIAVVATHLLGASDELAYAPLLFAKLSAYLSREHTVVVPGSAPS